MNWRVIRRIGYVVVTVVGLVAVFVGYQLKTGKEAPAAEPPPKPVKVLWADGGELGTITENGKDSSPLNGPASLIWAEAKRELTAMNIEPHVLFKQGLTVQLTVEQKAQDQAETAINEAMQGQPDNLRESLVAVDPATGAVIAYAGYNQEKPDLDYSSSAWFQPGSLSMVFDLVALLQQNKGLAETFDGRSPRKFGGTTISNAQGTNACGERCSVAEAMKQSVNTVFADIAFNITGTRNVAKAAIQAGIPSKVGPKGVPLEGTAGNPPNINIAIGGDVYQARVVDIAGAFATFASNGIRHAPHLVAKVINPEGGFIVYDGNESPVGTAAFDPDNADHNKKIARNVTEALLPIPALTQLPCAGDHQCAGKTGNHGCTGTHNTTKSDNCAAWMVGYTPQISTAVVNGTDDLTALKSADGAAITGAGLPGQIWKKFMDSYLSGRAVQPFPPYEPITG